MTSAKVANAARALDVDRALDMANTDRAATVAPETPEEVTVTPDKPDGGIETLVKPDKTQEAKAGDKIAITWKDNKGDTRRDEATVS